MEQLTYSIKEKYSVELNHIQNRLNHLKKGRVYELTNAKMDGYLINNIEKLEHDIYELLYKIQTGQNGFSQEMSEAISRLDD